MIQLPSYQTSKSHFDKIKLNESSTLHYNKANNGIDSQSDEEEQDEERKRLKSNDSGAIKPPRSLLNGEKHYYNQLD